MNKKDTKTIDQAISDAGQVKTVQELKDIAQNLQVQLNEHNRQVNEHNRQAVHHQTMAHKAQGALEVMLQLIPKEEVEAMIADEEKANGEAKEIDNSEG